MDLPLGLMVNHKKEQNVPKCNFVMMQMATRRLDGPVLIAPLLDCICAKVIQV